MALSAPAVEVESLGRFRFNRRASRRRGKLFYRLVQQAVQVAPQPYSAIVKKANRRAIPPLVGG